MRLFDTEVQKGQRICREVKVGELACFSDIKIPVLAVRGMHEGPTLWLTGAVHGDELNGPWAMRRFFWDLDPAELHGNLVLTPLLNPMAFQVNDKISHLDYLDLDQQFPGNAGGSYSERVACAVFTELKSCANYVIDFHTMGHPFSAVPYTVSKIVPGSSEETVRAAFTMARVLECIQIAGWTWPRRRANCQVRPAAQSTFSACGTTFPALWPRWEAGRDGTKPLSRRPTRAFEM